MAMDIGAFGSVQQRLHQFCEWVEGSVVGQNLPASWGDQNKRLDEYMNQMRQVWSFVPGQIEDLAQNTVFTLAQDPRYVNRFTQAQDTPEYRAIADNLELLDPESSTSEFAVAKDLKTRNEWYVRSVYLITAGAAAAVAGLFTAEVVLLSGIVGAVAGVVLGLVTLAAYYDTSLDQGFASEMKAAIEARGMADEQYVAPPAAGPADPSRLDVNMGLTQQLMDARTQSLAPLAKEMLVIADRNLDWIFVDNSYSSRRGEKHPLALGARIPVSSKQFRQELSQEVLGQVGNKYVRQLLERLRLSPDRGEDHLWLCEQLTAIGRKPLIKEALNPSKAHADFSVAGREADSYSVHTATRAAQA